MERLKSCKMRLTRMARDDSGVVAVVVVICMPLLLGLGALSIDMSYAYWTRTQLQHTASSAALAGASQLADLVDAEAAAKAEAFVFANANMATARFGTTLLAPDVTLGNWDAPTRTFTPMGGLSAVGYACNNPVAQETGGWGNCLWINAVDATTRTAQANGNPLNLFLASVLGMAQTDVNTAAIAWSQGSGEPPPPGEDNCYQDGMIAGNWVDIQSTNDFLDDFCVYGHCGVAMQSANFLEPGTSIAVGPDNAAAAALCEIGTPYMDEQGGPNPGLYDPPPPADYGNAPYNGLQPKLALKWTSGNMWPDVEFGDGDPPDLPDYLGKYPIVAVTLGSMLPGNFDAERDGWVYDPGVGPPACTPGPIETYYVVDGNADILAFSTLCNVAIIAHKITSGNDVIFENVVLVARDPSASGDPEIQFGYTIELGTDVIMDHVFVASREKVSLQQGAVLGGAPTCGSEVSVQIIAMEDVIFQSDSIISNVQVGAGRDFNMQSNGVLNLTGVGSTIQALRDVIVATEGTFNDCPDPPEVGGEDEGEDPLPTPGEIVGFDNRLVD